MHDARLPSWWQTTLEQAGQIEPADVASPDTPKPFPAPDEDLVGESTNQNGSNNKNYAALIKRAGPYILGMSYVM